MASGVQRAEIAYAGNGNQGSLEFREGDTAQSFTVGQALVLDSGEVDEHGDLQANELLVGLAGEAASGTQGTMITTHPFHMGQLIRLSCYHVTPASAVATYADIGKGVQIKAIDDPNSVGCTVADVATFDADASKSPFTIVQMEGTDATEQYRRILVTPKASHLAFGGFSGVHMYA